MTGVAVFGLEVIRHIPHDVTASTQGFATAGRLLYESTGRYGHSQLRELDVATGRVRRTRWLRHDLFGEGIAVVDDTIWQLTWREGTVLEWDRATLTVRRELPLQGEGWGLCFDGIHLVQSDGGNVLRFRDPVTFAETHSLVVALEGRPMPFLNDLAVVSGRLWANVLHADYLIGIDPATGVVTAVAEADELLTDEERAAVGPLNGVAPGGPDAVLLSGKRWPRAFEVRMHECPGREFTGWRSHHIVFGCD